MGIEKYSDGDIPYFQGEKGTDAVKSEQICCPPLCCAGDYFLIENSIVHRFVNSSPSHKAKIPILHKHQNSFRNEYEITCSFYFADPLKCGGSKNRFRRFSDRFYVEQIQ